MWKETAQMNGNNVKSVRCGTSRTSRKEGRNHLKDKVNSFRDIPV